MGRDALSEASDPPEGGGDRGPDAAPARQLREQTRRLRLLADAQRELAGLATSAEGLYDRIARIAQDAMGAEGAAFEMPEGERLAYRASAGMASAAPGLLIPRLDSLSGLALDSGQTLVCTDSETDPRVDRASCRTVGLRSMVVGVLRADGEQVGVIKVMSAQPNRFNEDDVAAMDVLVGSLGGVLERLRRQQQHDAALERRERRYRLLFTRNPHPMWVYDLETLRFLEVNGAAIALYGYGRDEFLARTILDIRPPEDHEGLRDFLRRLQSISGPTRHYRARHQLRDGRLIDVEISGDDIDFDGRRARLVLAHDVSARQQAERDKQAAELERERVLSELQHAVSHDPLTGLPRYATVQPWLEARIADGGPVCLLLVELDRFSALYQTLTHAAADEVLRRVGARLGALADDRVRVSHLAGDEFVVVAAGMDDAQVDALAQRLRERVAEPVDAGGARVSLTATVGIAVWPQHGDSATELLRRAEAACERGKAAGRDCVHRFSAEAMQALEDRMILGAHLRGAGEREELRLVYQPMFRGRGGRPVGMEALLRWQHPELGAVSPSRFIPVAESLGLMGEIGDWVVRAACRQLRAWREAGLPECRVAVNVSPLQLQRPGLVATVTDALQAHGVKPSQLELEITETALIENLDRARDKLRHFARLGVSVALDDFGTGYSSLAYLKELELHKLKIDKGFVRGLPGDHKAAAMARTIVSIAHQFGLTVAAEGVETAEQALFLEAIGCDLLQGYLLARPLEPDAAAALLASPAG
jgi:diguanylate cyclase (GGDEF)-like protein/PAS domain S-box-containing protein